MGSDALSKLTKAGETAWKSFQTKWYALSEAVHRSDHVHLADARRVGSTERRDLSLMRSSRKPFARRISIYV
jgi:hypothetical protein